MIYIIIPVLNRWNFTLECLLSLRNQTYNDFKSIVIDHGSTDGTSDHIQNEFPEVTVLKGDESMWWTAATNLGVRYAMEKNAEYVLTLNNDLVVESDYLQSLVDLSDINPKALVGSVSINKNNPNQVFFAGTKWNRWTAKYRSSIDLINFYSVRKYLNYFETDLLPGRGTLIPIEAFMQLGMFDERHFPHYAADEEFSNRCKRNGYYLLVSSNAIVKSFVETTGLKNVRKKKSLKYWKDLFVSRRSPINLKRRWLWARYNAPLPPIYFIFDLIRIIISSFKKT